jgi:hypothetical protein
MGCVGIRCWDQAKRRAPGWPANMERAASEAYLLLSGWTPDMRGVNGDAVVLFWMDGTCVALCCG